jgi:hypothetical protein
MTNDNGPAPTVDLDEAARKVDDELRFASQGRNSAKAFAHAMQELWPTLRASLRRQTVEVAVESGALETMIEVALSCATESQHYADVEAARAELSSLRRQRGGDAGAGNLENDVELGHALAEALASYGSECIREESGFASRRDEMRRTIAFILVRVREALDRARSSPGAVEEGGADGR